MFVCTHKVQYQRSTQDSILRKVTDLGPLCLYCCCIVGALKLRTSITTNGAALWHGLTYSWLLGGGVPITDSSI